MSLTDRQRTVLDVFRDEPARTRYVANLLGVSRSAINNHMNNLRDAGVELRRDPATEKWHVEHVPPEVDGDADADTPDETPTATRDTDPDANGDTTTDADPDGDLPDLSDVPQGSDPDESELSNRQRVIASELQSGATVDDLADELDERRPVITEHVRDLKRQGWQVYIDETAEHIAIEGDHTLRSSEQKGTRTRKANQWWETRHNAVTRRWKALDSVAVDTNATPDAEDWITAMSDLHAGDKVRGYDPEELIHQTSDLPGIIDHITERSLSLAQKHNSPYDTGYLLYNGDFVTNSGIYEGQFEQLDEWLDSQINILHDPLMRQIKTFSSHFDNVRVICQPGNHGDIRASGSSKQANADLILYKSLRNAVGQLQNEGLYENVGFKIGRAGNPTVFEARDGAIHGQLRHGENRSPQADTSARKKEWLSTILDSMNHDGDGFDVGYMGHHHVSGRIPWNGPPVFCIGTPKPGGEYPRKLGEKTGPGTREIALCHGLTDDGITGVFPIDERNL